MWVLDMRRRPLLITTCAIAAVACKPSAKDEQGDLCERTIRHMTSVMDGDDELEPPERAVAGMATAGAIAKCQKEGLSQAQADCILAAETFEQFMALGTCAALRENKPSWLVLPPTEAEMAEIMAQMQPPDGPRTGPVRYRQLTGSGGTTCGLRDDGSLQCWGSQSRVPSGSFSKIGWRWHLCGLDHSGTLVCASDTRGDDLSYLPKEPLVDFAEGPFHGCGVKRLDGSLVCWKKADYHEGSVMPPDGAFVEVVSGLNYSCARASDGSVSCFGSDARMAPEVSFTAIAGGLWSVCGLDADGAITCWGATLDYKGPPRGTFKQLSCGNNHCCAIRADDTAVCWGSQADGRSTPPEGRFSVIYAGVDHSCGVREDATVCWGSNHMGQGNVPQDPTDHNWHRIGF